MVTMLEQPSTTNLLEPDSQFVIPAATMWSNCSHLTSKQEPLPSHILGTAFGSKDTDNILLSQDFRPQVGPNKRPRSSKVQAPERARHLERNRVAANKCRLKKKHEQLQIQHALDEATSTRNTLLAELNELKEEVWKLKNKVFAHAKCGDHQINLQLTKTTQNVLGSTSLRRSSSFPLNTSSSEGSAGEGTAITPSTSSPKSLAVDKSVAHPEMVPNIFDILL
ncbi:Transcription factor Jun [Penicillium italicum]|uniref:Transcription factor Jun n=1 Tax=Penicillium italicum TaxID=40296 RepID=A0A0A2KNC2_PENIT|nr:Transcription factor Jun [Penicillium italicum]